MFLLSVCSVEKTLLGGNSGVFHSESVEVGRSISVFHIIRDSSLRFASFRMTICSLFSAQPLSLTMEDWIVRI